MQENMLNMHQICRKICRKICKKICKKIWQIWRSTYFAYFRKICTPHLADGVGRNERRPSHSLPGNSVSDCHSHWHCNFVGKETTAISVGSRRQWPTSASGSAWVVPLQVSTWNEPLLKNLRPCHRDSNVVRIQPGFPRAGAARLCQCPLHQQTHF